MTLLAAVLAGGITIFVLSNRPSQLTKEQAIEEARQFSPNQVCGQALTPARHTATGAEYTFPSTCLAPGWEVSSGE